MSSRSRLGLALSVFVSAACRRAGLVLLAALLLSVGAVFFAARNLGVQTDIVEMFSPDLPFRQTDADYRARFPHENDTLLVAIDGPAPELVAHAARRLTAALADETETFEEVYQPGRSRFLEEHALLFLESDELEDLTGRLAEAQAFLGRLSRDRTLRGFSVLLVHALESTDGPDWTTDLAPILERTTEAVDATVHERPHYLSWQMLVDGDTLDTEGRPELIIARPRLDYSTLLSSGVAIERVREIARSLQIDEAHTLRVRISGSVALRHEELQTLRRGAGVATTLAFILVAGVLYFGLRSIRLVAASLVTLVVGLVWTAAFAAMTIGHLNLISVAFGVLYIGLGIDFAIHLCLRYQELISRGGDRTSAISTAAGDVGVSITFCAITTSIAFYAFVPTSFRGVSELGLIAGTGMLISLVVSLTVLPALLSRIGPTKRRTPVVSFPWLVDLPTRHANAVRIVAVVAALATLPLLPGVTFDMDPLHLRDPETESVSTLQDLLDDNLNSPWHAVVLESDASQLAETQERLRELEEVGRVVALGDFVPKGQDEKLEMIDELSLLLGVESWSTTETPGITTPERLEAIDELLATLEQTTSREPKLQAAIDTLSAKLRELVEGLGDSEDTRRTLDRLETALLGALPATLQQLESAMEAGPVQPETLPDTLRRQWVSTDGMYRLAVFPARSMSDPEALREFVAAVNGCRPDAAGAPVFHLAAADSVIVSFRQALAIAFGAIGVLLVVVLRSVRDAGMVLVPVVLAGLLLAAAAVLVGIPFNFANIIAVPLLLGMGVDGGIHMVLRHRASPRETDLLATSTSRAVLYSNLTTVAGFGSLALSPHPGMASLGQVLALGILFVLIGALIVLPSLAGMKAETPPRH